MPFFSKARLLPLVRAGYMIISASTLDLVLQLKTIGVLVAYNRIRVERIGPISRQLPFNIGKHVEGSCCRESKEGEVTAAVLRVHEVV